MNHLHTTRPMSCWVLLSALSALLASSVALGQGLTEAQLKSLLPDEHDLVGFVAIQPAGELRRVPWRADPARRLTDVVRLRCQVSGASEPVQLGDRIGRTLYSEDGVFLIAMSLVVGDTADSVQGPLVSQLRFSSVPWTAGTFGSSRQLGDHSWTHPWSAGGHLLMFRYGRAWVSVSGGISNAASEAGSKAEFPAEAVQAVAEAIWLRLAQNAALVGAADQLTSVTVNGRPLVARAPVLSGRAIVPVKEVAQAAGWRVAWDAKTGRVTLNKPAGPRVAMVAGSSSARTSAGKTGKAGKSVALGSMVLTDKGQPVMALEDLVALLGGKVTGRTAERLTVRL